MIMETIFVMAIGGLSGLFVSVLMEHKRSVGEWKNFFKTPEQLRIMQLEKDVLERARMAQRLETTRTRARAHGIKPARKRKPAAKKPLAVIGEAGAFTSSTTTTVPAHRRRPDGSEVGTPTGMFAPATAKPKRIRRTKAQIAADNEAKAGAL